MDDVNNIQLDYENSTISQTIANISTSLSNSLYKFITNKNYTGFKQANTSYVSNKWCIIFFNLTIIN